MKTLDKTTVSRINLIAALGARSRAIGKNGKLLWQLPGDLPRFRALTDGHPVVMGRKTWDSLPPKFRPLPGRTNIVVTRMEDYPAGGARVAHSLPEALSLAKRAEGAREIFVIGGGELYRAALPFADRLYLTLVDSDAEGDTFFPPYEDEFKTVLAEELHTSGTGVTYRFLDLSR